jgi:hypothetical protein
LCSWSVFLLHLDDDFTNTSAVDLSHQLNLVNSLLNLVTVKVLHQLSFDRLNVQGSTVHITDVIFNIKPFALTEDSFHDLSVASLNGLLSGRGDNPATLRVTGTVFSSPLTTKDTLILKPFV